MQERTYTLMSDQAEVMVNVDEDGIVLDVYAYVDDLKTSKRASLFSIPGRNPLFRHAGNPEKAWRFVQRNAIDIDQGDED